MTSMPMTNFRRDRSDTPYAAAPQPVVVQILSLLLFGGFAIVATVLAFVAFWPAGFALAVILAWYGFGPVLHQRPTPQNMDWVSTLAPQPPSDRSGNTSFDAYRADVMKRLEDEQHTFEGFLDRLRDAKDESEFDTFMDDRARANREAPGAASANDTVRSGEY